jgi:hypothetical protein
MHNEILSGCQRFLPGLFGQRHPETGTEIETETETELKICVREFLYCQRSSKYADKKSKYVLRKTFAIFCILCSKPKFYRPL